MQVTWSGLLTASGLVEFPFPALDVTTYAFLSFRAAECPGCPDGAAFNPEGDKAFLVALSDLNGAVGVVPIEPFGTVPEFKATRNPDAAMSLPTSIWRTFRIPLEAFALGDQDLDFTAITGVQFLFGGADMLKQKLPVIRSQGVLTFDEIEFSR